MNIGLRFPFLMKINLCKDQSAGPCIMNLDFFYGLVHSGLEPIQLLPLLRVAGVNLSIPLTVKSQHIKWLLGLALIFHTR